MFGERHQITDLPTTAPEDAYVLPFREFISILWRRAWIIALAAILFAGAAVGISLTRQPVYEASIKVLVRQEGGITDTPTNVGGLQDLTVTMTAALPSRPLAEKVIQQENLQISPDTFLNERLSVTQVEDTQLIEVAYSDTDPQRAQRVVNTVGEVFSERVSNISSGASAITATVWEPATVPGRPISPNPLRDGFLAGAVGAMLGVGLVFLLEFFDDRWRSPEELEQVSGVPVFGLIPHFEAPKGKKKGKG